MLGVQCILAQSHLLYIHILEKPVGRPHLPMYIREAFSYLFKVRPLYIL